MLEAILRARFVLLAASLCAFTGQETFQVSSLNELSAYRWFTGGQGGSGQEVIAPGSGDPAMAAFEDVRKAVEPHARQGTSEDLAPESSAFTGSARTLDGTARGFFHLARLCSTY